MKVPFVVAVVGLAILAGLGCDGDRRARQARLPDATLSTNRLSMVPAVVSGQDLTSNVLLTVTQSDLTPAVLWRSGTERVRLFGNMEASGIGGPTYVAYSSPTGIAILKPGGSLGGTNLRENWLLVGFPGAFGWDPWDSPWAVFLQRRPGQVTLTNTGLDVAFAGPAGYGSMLPLYGAYKPPQKGREILKGAGLKEKGMLTWEWPIVVARDPLTRLRYWSGATRWYPVARSRGIRFDDSRGRMILGESFAWLEIPDEWGTRPIRVAPMDPVLGLALTKGEAMPLDFSKPPFDFEMPTSAGPFWGVPDAGSFEVTLPILDVVNETEMMPAIEAWNEVPGGTEYLSVFREAWQDGFRRLQALHAEMQSAAGGATSAGSVFGDWSSEDALAEEVIWLARGLAWIEPEVKGDAGRFLGQFCSERWLDGRMLDAMAGVGDGVSPLARATPVEPGPRGGELGIRLRILPAVWACVLASGDTGRLKEVWPRIRRQFPVEMGRSRGGFGREVDPAIGRRASVAVAFCRLAWAAGDGASYESGCMRVAEELLFDRARIRGMRWFREQQPWESVSGIVPEGALLSGRRSDQGDRWWIPKRTPVGQVLREVWERRWGGFHDLDIARFLRQHGGAELRTDLGVRPPDSGVAAEERASRNDDLGLVHARLVSWFGTESTRNSTVFAVGRLGALSRVERMAQVMTVLRIKAEPRYERLISLPAAGGFATPSVEVEKVGESDGGTPLRDLAVTVSVTGPGRWWPRLQMSGWTTPAGEMWHVGDVAAGEAVERPVVRTNRLSEHAVQWEFSRAPGDRGR